MTEPDGSDPSQHDPGGMLDVVERSPEQWERALAVARDAPPPPTGDARAVVVAGMGGSGISADVAAAVAERVGAVPVVGVKGYELPAFVGAETLVVGVSYSGTTEETLACLADAGERGAPRYVITTGGDAARIADDEGVPWVEVPVDAGTEAGRQPRANLPNLTVPLLVTLERAGVLRGVSDDLAAVPEHLAGLSTGWMRDVPAQHNAVRRAAAQLTGAVPVFYGARGLPAVVALRGKCQVNENAERPAFHHELPELDHNELVGWSPRWRDAADFTVVDVRSPADEHPRVHARAEITAELAAAGTAGRIVVPLDGPSPLARFAAGVLFVDLLSVHLALLDGVDPTPVRPIAQLKERLAGLPA